MRRILSLLLAFFTFGSAAEDKDKMEFPPKPKWKPSDLAPTADAAAERFSYYTDAKRSFVVFKYGTCVLVDQGLSKETAIKQGQDILAKVYNYHPDMNPKNMDDGNVLIEYSQPAFTVVFSDVCKANWDTIDKNHQDAICPAEVLMGPLGANKFDDFGKKLLFGRCFMFLDAQANEVVKVVLK